MKAVPFLRWIGGKSKLAPRILELLPSQIETYHEPFVGGGSVFFEMRAQERAKRYVLSDVNEHLINAYVSVRDEPGALLGYLNLHSESHSEGWYYVHRTFLNESPVLIGTAAQRAARFIYLNKSCFNGIWRVNKAGKMNTPWGKHETFVVDHENILACSEALQGVELQVAPFSESMRSVMPGDAVYLDPPYVPLTQTANFTSYSKDGFGSVQQELLATDMRYLANNGIPFVCSNSDTPFTRELYGNFNIETVQMARSVNSSGSKRGKINELLVTPRL